MENLNKGATVSKISPVTLGCNGSCQQVLVQTASATLQVKPYYTHHRTKSSTQYQPIPTPSYKHCPVHLQPSLYEPQPCTTQELNLGCIGKRCTLSPLHCPCFPESTGPSYLDYCRYCCQSTHYGQSFIKCQGWVQDGVTGHLWHVVNTVVRGYAVHGDARTGLKFRM